MKTLGGVARIFRDADAYERAIQIADSENFGLCFCVGNWAEGGKSSTGKDVYEMVRHFGSKGRIFKVHFRNVDQPLPVFQETFIDNGYIDMYRVMLELKKAKLVANVPFWTADERLAALAAELQIGYRVT